MVLGVGRRFLFLDSPRAAFAPSSFCSPPPLPFLSLAAKNHSPRPKSKTKITQDANLKGSKSLKSQTLKTKKE